MLRRRGRGITNKKNWFFCLPAWLSIAFLAGQAKLLNFYSVTASVWGKRESRTSSVAEFQGLQGETATKRRLNKENSTQSQHLRILPMRSKVKKLTQIMVWDFFR